MMQEFDLTPDPRVLVALTHTPLQPLDALCELIDNAIDSFQSAQLQGEPLERPTVVIELPGPTEVDQGRGYVQVSDNGPGLSAEQAERALRAGFSGNNPFDSLGLFGMGFNISTGKLGVRTRFLTYQKQSTQALEVIVDLVAMTDAKSYRVPVTYVDKPKRRQSGTVIEITGWWPAGNPNSGFVRKLVGYGKNKIRSEIGRRYSTILRAGSVAILVNGERCEPYEHCAWDRSRSVERRDHGRIPARFDLDHVVGIQTRCQNCNTKVADGSASCQNCGSSSYRTIEERVQGWFGIQRFENQTQFGIDLIRNGRAIRIAEQAAFFEYTDEFKNTTKDYPIDSYFGRIIGEVHLDHVPVDFLKQDFQRSSEEWQRAIRYLRGDSSLQPTKPNADKNISPLFKLYQGYRRVRTAGTADMYMGYWDQQAGKPQRISRSIESEYYQKFLDRVPGFYDDAEWWKLVEQADRQPAEVFVVCADCGADSLATAEECLACGAVLIGKPCLNEDCGQLILRSAVTCPHCGSSQVPEVRDPWPCRVCDLINVSEADTCARCGAARGAPSLSSHEYLYENADKDDALSWPGCSIMLADGSHSQPIDVIVYVSRGALRQNWNGISLPMIVFKDQSISIFLDRSHPLFLTYQLRPEYLVAVEVAQYIYDKSRSLLTVQYQALHTLPVVLWRILERRWRDILEDSPENVKNDIKTLFGIIRERLAQFAAARAIDLFNELAEHQQRSLVDNLIGSGIDIGLLGELKQTGQFLSYIDEDTVVTIFNSAPEIFFDDQVWKAQYSHLPDLPSSILSDVRRDATRRYANYLEDCAQFLRYERPEPLLTSRTRASIDYLLQQLA